MKYSNSKKKIIWIGILLLLTCPLAAQVVDLSKAAIIASKNIPSPVRETAIRVLKEEIAQRTNITLKESDRIVN